MELCNREFPNMDYAGWTSPICQSLELTADNPWRIVGAYQLIIWLVFFGCVPREMWPSVLRGFWGVVSWLLYVIHLPQSEKNYLRSLIQYCLKKSNYFTFCSVWFFTTCSRWRRTSSRRMTSNWRLWAISLSWSVISQHCKMRENLKDLFADILMPTDQCLVWPFQYSMYVTNITEFTREKNW